MPSWLIVALYLFIGGMIGTSFCRDDGEPDYGFITVIMLFWPIVIIVFFGLLIVTLINAIRSK